MKMIDDRCFGECMEYPICCIYMIMRISTGQKYIGQTINFYDRNYSHSLGKDDSNDGIDAAIKKYGWNNFIVQILEIVPFNIDILNKRERFWIKYYNTYENPYHYNKTPGGSGVGISKAWNHIDEICELYQNNIDISTYDLANQFNCSQRLICSILKAKNIDVQMYPKRNSIWDHVDEICELYQNTNINITKLAKQFNGSRKTVKQILKENNVKIKNRSVQNNCLSAVWDHANEICALYENTNISIRKIANQFNCDRATITTILNKNNVKITKQPKSEIWNHIDEIRTLCYSTNITIKQLAEHFNCSESVVSKLLKENNIKTRAGGGMKNFSDEICKMYDNGIKVSDIAKHFNCHLATIYRILNMA